MQKNIKKIIDKQFKNSDVDLPKNHRKKFEKKLFKKLHKSKNITSNFLKITASFLLFGLSMLVYTNLKTDNSVKEIYTLGSLSPELERIEDYYTKAITYELAKLEVTEGNQPLMHTYFNKLEQLTKQYQIETKQLDINSINEKTINALIDNLQMRLQLLLQLKEQLRNVKNIKNEKITL